MKLHLGVVDQNYTDHTESISTGEVADLLEEKYHVMEIFFDMHKKDIAGYLEDSIAGAIENTLGGAKVVNPFSSATGKIEKKFRDYIDSQEHGIQLKKHKAPKAGARKKRQYVKVKEVTSFIDSGLFRGSFKSWIEK